MTQTIPVIFDPTTDDISRMEIEVFPPMMCKWILLCKSNQQQMVDRSMKSILFYSTLLLSQSAQETQPKPGSNHSRRTNISREHRVVSFRELLFSAEVCRFRHLKISNVDPETLLSANPTERQFGPGDRRFIGETSNSILKVEQNTGLTHDAQTFLHE